MRPRHPPRSPRASGSREVGRADRLAHRGPGHVLPLLMTGDFNVAAHGNPVYGQLLALSLKDTWDAAATFHGYRPLVPDGDRIDWILATAGVTVQSATINMYEQRGQYPSDHLPVQVSLTLA
ncbi:endonuclease/exonuclease/phosphatase family protein [Streptomyces sp. NPDC056390]|uniref:endonuclease/exonuclease/phosphatase family protein n=1 Tax=Streptomyces sp. NPDC056390 TaxID=3345806 RepID=UPI0035DAE9A3